MINMAFPIDFVRQVIEQTLLEESIKDTTLFGGKNQVNLFSFYEQLQKEDEINRYVEIYRDLTDQQNRSGLIMNGTIIAPENPTITNLYSHLIIPMSFTCTFRVKLGDRDNAINTINNLIKVLKGRKQDMVEFDNGKIFKLGVIGNRISIQPDIACGDFLVDNPSPSQIFDTNYFESVIAGLQAKGISNNLKNGDYFYYSKIGGRNMKVFVAQKQVENNTTSYATIIDDGTHANVIFPPEHNGINGRYKLSMSFDSIRCDEPRNLNANEYCVISFGGSATLVDANTRLGNDLVKVGIAKKKVLADPVITINGNTEWLEPLEQPSSNSANTMNNLLKSSNFLTNTHTDSLAVSRQYTFVADYYGIVGEWYNYARYGTRVNGTNINYTNGVSPNLIYNVIEVISFWGNVYVNESSCKIIESIDIENTESDVESITIPFQVQGE